MNQFSLNFLKYSLFLSLLMLLFAHCKNEPTIQLSEQDIATKWAEMTLHVTQHTPANSPTFASRCLGYIGLTMYESIVHGQDNYQTLAGQLNELEALPLPETDKMYNWELALNAGQAEILRSIYIQTADTNKVKIDSLEQLIFNSVVVNEVEEEVAKRSVDYGKSIAQAIFEWSKTDGGHRGYLKNFDKKLVHPTFKGSWKPPLFAQSFSHHPLHPHWGKNRTFLKENSEVADPQIIPYDTAKTSPYYQEFLAVYEKDKMLTQNEKEMALWWGDDPADTFTPPGHSYYLATIAIKNKQPSLIKCAETYARTGMAVADAFIKCWKWKYQFFSERPNTFIPQFIDLEWESFWPDPPFPAFPSGHAIQAATTATVLIDLFGNEMAFTDDAHVGRERDEVREVDFIAQEFETFWQVAEETADSRFYGGIHTPQDNSMGLEKGKEIGKNINQLNWRIRVESRD
ncbi:MAG: vanadium-dependent haloperoxidase [Bacteroidota bacterium]